MLLSQTVRNAHSSFPRFRVLYLSTIQALKPCTDFVTLSKGINFKAIVAACKCVWGIRNHVTGYNVGRRRALTQMSDT